jgi:hypothetical protein
MVYGSATVTLVQTAQPPTLTQYIYRSGVGAGGRQNPGMGWGALIVVICGVSREGLSSPVMYVQRTTHVYPSIHSHVYNDFCIA